MCAEVNEERLKIRIHFYINLSFDGVLKTPGFDMGITISIYVMERYNPPPSKLS